MKRLISTLIAAVMVLSAMTFAAPIGASAAQHTLDAHNVAVDVPYFSGTTNFYEITGKSTASTKNIEDMGSINISDKTGSGELNLDGTITAAEWGAPIINVQRDYAATLRGAEPSAENTYYWHVSKSGDAYPQRYDPDKNFSYKVWMAWDEDYLYIAAETDDPDGAFANNPDADIWNGDCLQFIVDPDGPNSVVNGQGFRASEPTKWPWASRYADWREDGDVRRSSKVANIGVGYLGSEGGVNMYDMETRYFPSYDPTYLESGEIDYWSTNWQPYDIFYKTFAEDPTKPDNPLMGDKYAYAAVLPTSVPTADNRLHTVTTYEVAVPWELVSGSYTEFDQTTQQTLLHYVDPNPQAGDEYGLSIVMLGGARGATEYNQWLTWGSGICGAQTDTADFLTAGGSNSMVLVSDELGTLGCDHPAFSEPTCIAPYVCTSCGYEKGFKTGHKYLSELVTPLGAYTDGVIRATCQTCGDVQTITVPAVEQVTNFECPATPVVNPPLDPNSEWFTDGWSTIYRDDNDNIEFNPDGSMKTTYKAIDGEMVFDLRDAEAGTYFPTNTSQRSFSYKYSFKLNPEAYATYFNEDETPSDNYVQGLYNVFGGIAPGQGSISYGTSYAAGFFTDDPGSTEVTFKIIEAGGASVVYPAKLEERGEPQRWVFNETGTIDLGTDWHDVVFVYDESEGAVFYYLDGECIMAAWDEGFKMNGNDQVTIIRKMEQPCMIKDMAIGSTTAFLTNPVSSSYTVTCDGQVIGTFAEGDEVDLPALENKLVSRKDARFYTWEGEEVVRGRFGSSATSPTKRTYTMTMPGHDVVLTSKFVLIGDANADGAITVKDIAQVKKAMSSAITLTDIEKEAADVNLDGVVNSRDLPSIKKAAV